MSRQATKPPQQPRKGMPHACRPGFIDRRCARPFIQLPATSEQPNLTCSTGFINT